ncbi:MAG TPA: hypothetical protein IAB01_07490 [Candidatus Avidesulfovibrio excrementigallinarum]|nr:hypothetical protein [Candidatus Avidesulfovibrio excrementigallinarum]
MNMQAFGGLLGLLAGAAAAKEAEGAVRPDIVEVIRKALKQESLTDVEAGSLESTKAVRALLDSPEYHSNEGYFTLHGLTRRKEQDNWTEERIADAYKGIYDSPDTLLIPNVLGKNAAAKVALWNPSGLGKRSWYGPVMPHKNGFKVITVFNPKTSTVRRRLRERGDWEDGAVSEVSSVAFGSPGSSIHASTWDVPAPGQASSGPLSAVNPPLSEKKLNESAQSVNEKGLNSKLPAVAGGALAGTTLSSDTAHATSLAAPRRFPADEPGWVNPEPPLETPLVSPVDLVLAPAGVAKASGKVAAVAAEPFVAWGMSVFALKKGKREAAAPRRPAQSERKNRVFSAKRQAVWFETQRVSN